MLVIKYHGSQTQIHSMAVVFEVAQSNAQMGQDLGGIGGGSTPNTE